MFSVVQRRMSMGRCLLAFGIAFAHAEVAALAQDQDDTAAVLALSELGAQLQLNQGRIVGLTLQGEAIDDEAMQSLAGLDRLRSLTLRDTKVTGEGLKALQDLTLLAALSIHDTPIFDRDIDELADIEAVVSYDLFGTKISGMGKQRLENLLRKAMRASTVRLHFGGFLGVTGFRDGDRCQLTSVVADSPAADAGLQVGDLIVEFDRRLIKDFSALAEAVALTALQQPVRVVIERNGMRMTMTASLRRPTSLRPFEPP